MNAYEYECIMHTLCTFSILLILQTPTFARNLRWISKCNISDAHPRSTMGFLEEMLEMNGRYRVSINKLVWFVVTFKFWANQINIITLMMHVISYYIKLNVMNKTKWIYFRKYTKNHFSNSTQCASFIRGNVDFAFRKNE